MCISLSVCLSVSLCHLNGLILLLRCYVFGWGLHASRELLDKEAAENQARKRMKAAVKAAAVTATDDDSDDVRALREARQKRKAEKAQQRAAQRKRQEEIAKRKGGRSSVCLCVFVCVSAHSTLCKRVCVFRVCVVRCCAGLQSCNVFRNVFHSRGDNTRCASSM